MEGKKRCREDASEAVAETKRLRPEIFLEILDDDADSSEGEPASQEIAIFMKSFEAEIGISAAEEQLPDPRSTDLGYLLEASDDELGLPPAALSSSSSEKEEAVVVNGESESAGYDSYEQIWGFDGGISGFDSGVMDFGIPLDDGVAFDYPDVFYEPFDFSDNSWRHEILPAI